MDDTKSVREWLALVVIPFTVLVVTYMHQASEERQAEQRHRDEVALKFIEMGWDAIERHDTARTKEALRVLALFDPQIANQLSMVSIRDSIRAQVPDTAEARSVFSSELVRDALVNTEITMHGDADEGRNLPIAISRYLGKLQGRGDIGIRWMRYPGTLRPTTSTLMYTPSAIRETAELQRILEERFPEVAFELQEMEGDKPIIHVFVAP